MENLVIEKGIAFFAQDFSDAMSIDKLKINLTPTDVDNIKNAMELVNNNKFINSINIDLDGSVEYLNDDDEDIESWKIDVERLVVYNNSVYYYAQNKWHSGDQIESDCITLDDLGIVLTA
jgi:hypothetical protein